MDVFEIPLQKHLPLILTLLSLLLCIWFVSYRIRRNKYVTIVNKIPGMVPTSYFLGNVSIVRSCIKNSMDLSEGFFQAILSCTYLDINVHGILRAWLGPEAIITLSSPETVEPLLMSNSVINKSVQYKFLLPWLGLGLLTSSGDKWRKHRKLLTPSFHFRILEDFVPIINEQTTTFCRLLKAKCSLNEGLIDNISTDVTMFALDVICETGMGVTIDAQNNPEIVYVKAIHNAGQMVIQRTVYPWLVSDFIFGLTSGGKQFKSDLEVIKERKEEFVRNMKEGKEMSDDADDLGIKRRRAFLDTLLDQHLKDPESLSEVDIREEVDTFMFEGHDTTTWGMSWAIYLVGLYPEVQEKVHQELDSIFGDDKERALTMDDLKAMKYIECVVKEALRLYPSVPMMARMVTENISVCGYALPKGSTALIFPYMVHRDPKHWPDPEKFEPARFLIENNRNRHPFAYIPFSGGPRNCIGQKFALLEEKALLGSLFRRFNVTSLDQRDKIRLAPAMILKSQSPIRVRLEIR